MKNKTQPYTKNTLHVKMSAVFLVLRSIEAKLGPSDVRSLGSVVRNCLETRQEQHTVGTTIIYQVTYDLKVQYIMTLNDVFLYSGPLQLS